MRKVFFIVIPLLSLVLLAGCAKQAGISQEEYNKVVAEKESLQNKITELLSENESLSNLVNSKLTEDKVQNLETTVLYRDEDCFGKYTGPLANGVPEGTGRFISDNGWQYNGEFKNGVLDGNGTIEFEDGGSFNGLIKDGWVFSGVLSYKDNDIEIIDGEMDSKSVLMSILRNVEKGQEEIFSNEVMSKYSHRIDSVKPAYDFIEYFGMIL